MEPAAPGTEDEAPIMYSTLNKRENEQERLLNQKGFLRNGKYENIFELSYVNGSETWYCKLCECPILGKVFQHEIGRRHIQNMHNTNNYTHAQLSEENKKDGEEEELDQPSVAPGEPVPPGFEVKVDTVAQIQPRLDGFKAGPLVALEYLVELQDYDPSKEPIYLCILCDKKGDPRTVLTHLASYNHISKYLQKHFPTSWRSLTRYMIHPYKRNWQAALQKIAEGIEKKFGRLKPLPVDKDKFEADRMVYLSRIAQGKHFSELSGYTFEELIIHEELTKVHEEDKKDEKDSATNNWGGQPFIQKPFKKRSPSPPKVSAPNKKGGVQKPAYVQAVGQKTQMGKESGKPNSSSTLSGSSTFAMDGGNSRSEAAGRVQDRQRRSSLSSVSSDPDTEPEGWVRSNKLEFNRSRGAKADRFSNRAAAVYRGRDLPYQRRRSPSPRRRSPVGRHRSPVRYRRLRSRSRSSTPKNDRKTAEKEKEEERLRKVEEFKKLGRAIENDMAKTLKQHEKNPEKHPNYNEEWKKFWNRRYKELQSQGVDASKHDFKPEWIEFWNKRMVEIHSDEVRAKKEALRKRLGLDELGPIKFKIVPPGKHNMPNTPMAALPDQDNEVIVIEDKDETRSNSPWEEDLGRVPYAARRRSPFSKRTSPKRNPTRGSPIWKSPDLRGSSRQTSDSRSTGRQSPVRRSPTRKSPFKRSPVQKSPVRSPIRSSPSRRSPIRRSPFRKSRSTDRGLKRKSPSRSMSRDRSKSRNMSPFPRSRDSRDVLLQKDRSSFSRERSPKQIKSREDSWDRSRDYREPSYEPEWPRERFRTMADLPPWATDGYRPTFDPLPHVRDVRRVPMYQEPIVPSLRPPPEEEDENDNNFNVVDVLRILTALEDKLGSLGPKVIDLLAQALALEKKEANSSESLLDNDIHCVLLETVKEKLKGQLLTGLVDIIQERAFKKAIRKTAALIHLAGQRKKKPRFAAKKAPVSVPGVGTVDKAAIAKQIANALIMQGKTDVTQAELEQLINAVVGMAEASKNSNKPMTTAAFLQQISDGKAGTSGQKSQHAKMKMEDIEKFTEPLTPSPGRSSTMDMENLSDSDLQTLLQNFKDLSTDEQHNLINYLKKLEYQEPERVEKLRKFVNLDPKATELEDDSKNSDGRQSPFSSRLAESNSASTKLINIDSEEENEQKVKTDKEPSKKIQMDSEDEDYTFEDVVKSVSKNVKDREIETSKKIVEQTMKFENSKKDVDLTNPKELISSLMSNISKTAPNSNQVDLLGFSSPSKSSNILNNPDLAKTLSSINMSNLASIMNSVKNLPGQAESSTMYEPPPKTDISNVGPPQTARDLIFDTPHQILRDDSSRGMNPADVRGDLSRRTGSRHFRDDFDGMGPGLGPAPGLLGPGFNTGLRPLLGPGGSMRPVAGAMPPQGSFMPRTPYPTPFGGNIPHQTSQRGPRNFMDMRPRFGSSGGGGYGNRW